MSTIIDISCVKIEPEQEEETLRESDLDLGVNNLVKTEINSEIDIGPVKIEPGISTKCQILNSNPGSVSVRNVTVPQKKQPPAVAAKDSTKRYECSHCPRYFERRDELEIHTQIHTYNLLYKCSYCPNSFSHKSVYTAHMYAHTGKFPFKCPDCPQGFLKNCDLKKHVQLHNVQPSKRPPKIYKCRVYPLQCPQCPRRFGKTHELEIHLRVHSDKLWSESSLSNDPLQCPQCPRSFMKSEELEIHLQIHSDKLQYKCPHCPISLAHKSIYLSHISEHTGQFPHKCRRCQQGFMRKLDLMNHSLCSDYFSDCDERLGEYRLSLKKCTENSQTELNKNSNKEEATTEKGKPPKCESSLQANSIKSQIRDDSDNVKTLKSTNRSSTKLNRKSNEIYPNKEKNEKQNRNESSLETSSKMHRAHVEFEHNKTVKVIKDITFVAMKNDKKQSIDQKSYLPNLDVEKSLVDSNILNKTERSEKNEKNEQSKSEEQPITSLKSYSCKICNTEFANINNLRLHEKCYTHSEKELGNRPYKCDYCPLSFLQAYNLTVHMRKHTGERPYQCPHCPRNFIKNSALKVHIRTHSGKKTYKCDHCPRTFVSSSNLSKHMQIRCTNLAGNQFYKCPHCPRTFAQNSHFITHFRGHAAERRYQCTHCSKGFKISHDLKQHLCSHTEERPYT